MIDFATLMRVDATADSGRNRPIRGGIIAVTDDRAEVYIKPSGWKELNDLSVVREYIAVCIAGLLGLPVCKPFWVECPTELHDAQPLEGYQKTLGQCTWPAFATEHAGTQWGNWLAREAIDPDCLQLALAIFAFDAFLDNPDRRGANPNLLVKGKEMRIIDHELAFAFTSPLLLFHPAPPWEANSLDWITNGDRQHILYPSLMAFNDIDVENVRQSWASLKNDEIDAILAGLPATFGSVITPATRAIQRVKDIRDNIDGCIAELERILS